MLPFSFILEINVVLDVFQGYIFSCNDKTAAFTNFLIH